jgi:hypothetical protein
MVFKMIINKTAKISSVSFALMLVVSIFAFAYVIGSMEMVSGTTFPKVGDDILAGEEFSVGGIIYTAKVGFAYTGEIDLQNRLNNVAFETVVRSPQVEKEDSAIGDAKGSILPSPINGAGAVLEVGGEAINSPQAKTYIGGADKPLTIETSAGGNLGTINNGDSFTITRNPGTDKTTYDIEITSKGDRKVISGVSQGVVDQLNSNKDTEYAAIKQYGLPEGSTPNADGTWNIAGGGIATIKDGKAEYSQGTMKTIFSDQTPFAVGQIWQGISWGATVSGMVLTIGGIFIKDKQTLNAAAGGLFAGIMVGKAWYGIFGKGGISLEGQTGGWTIGNPTNAANSVLPGKTTTWGSVLGSKWTAGIVGAATAWLVYNAMWSKEDSTTETVTFNCLPWEAPHGGNDCELCNDADLPCSEYRCKSLGQSCAIVNRGTKEERCVDINPRDVSPPIIKPNNADILDGYEYFDIVEMPPGAGFKIRSKTTSTGCIPAYTAVQFGIMTDEPSQCKIDIAPKGNYSKMATYLNGDNLYKYNHTEILNLPSSADLKNSSITLKNGKELTFYMRCRDAAGNSNEADYALTVCVDPSPDNTAPLVQGTSIQNKGCVPADSENATVQFYINEPSECRWDYFDKDFEQMNNNMSCSTSAVEINAVQSYTCNTLLKGVGRDGNNFYVRCKDQPEGINESKRNTNKESYIFNLRRSNQLKLKLVQPNETIYGVIRPTPVELYSETLFGCEDNKAICYYSTTGATNSFVQFFDTDKSDGVHTQRLDLNDGTYTYYVRCVDSGGNVANTTTTFRVNIDTNAPVVARAYEEEGYLKIVTPLNSECVYNSESCDFLFSEGTSMPYANSTTHVTEWFADKKYFIKCRDQYRSEPVDCSLIVRPTENFLGV